MSIADGCLLLVCPGANGRVRPLAGLDGRDGTRGPCLGHGFVAGVGWLIGWKGERYGSSRLGSLWRWRLRRFVMVRAGSRTLSCCAAMGSPLAAGRLTAVVQLRAWISQDRLRCWAWMNAAEVLARQSQAD